MEKVQLIATSTFGMESIVAQEIRSLGYENLKVDNGKIALTADLEAICRLNLWLRTSDRVRLLVGEFEAKTFEELFEKTKALPWAYILPENAAFPVEGKSVKSTLFSVPHCQSIVKKAVVESLKKKYKRSWFEETGPLYKIEVALLKDRATITIDTSGPGLHKRGYRKINTHAPIKETLAAGLVILSKWEPEIPLIDPFCGSGTIPIEAALIGLNIAPGINRNFAAENWPQIPKKLWEKCRMEAKEKINLSKKLDIAGYDADAEAIKIAQSNALKAMVGNQISFEQRSLNQLSSKKKYGKIICNPPYGERLGSKKEVEKLYKEMGRIFKKLDTWSYYILTSHRNFEKLFRRKATKKRKLYNGDIRVDYYQYYGPKPPKTAT